GAAREPPRRGPAFAGRSDPRACVGASRYPTSQETDMRKMMLVAGVLVAVVWQVPAEDKKDAAKVVGTWSVTAEEKDGKQQTADGIKDKQVKITRDTITCMDKDRKTDMACKYEIDSTRTPWMITMTCTEGEHKGKTLKGI